MISSNPLEDYLKNLQIGKIFSKNQYGQSKIIKFGLSKNRNSIVVQCFDVKNNIKSWYIVKITFENNLFIHTTYTSCFTNEGAEKYYIIALGEEWTGGDVFDDFCQLVICQQKFYLPKDRAVYNTLPFNVVYKLNSPYEGYAKTAILNLKLVPKDM